MAPHQRHNAQPLRLPPPRTQQKPGTLRRVQAERVLDHLYGLWRAPSQLLARGGRGGQPGRDLGQVVLPRAGDAEREQHLAGEALHEDTPERPDVDLGEVLVAVLETRRNGKKKGGGRYICRCVCVNVSMMLFVV